MYVGAGGHDESEGCSFMHWMVLHIALGVWRLACDRQVLICSVQCRGIVCCKYGRPQTHTLVCCWSVFVVVPLPYRIAQHPEKCVVSPAACTWPVVRMLVHTLLAKVVCACCLCPGVQLVCDIASCALCGRVASTCVGVHNLWLPLSVGA